MVFFRIHKERWFVLCARGNDTVDGDTETDICDGGGQGDTVTNCE